jgi:hypothetical protein
MELNSLGVATYNLSCESLLLTAEQCYHASGSASRGRDAGNGVRQIAIVIDLSNHDQSMVCVVPQ